VSIEREGDGLVRFDWLVAGDLVGSVAAGLLSEDAVLEVVAEAVLAAEPFAFELSVEAAVLSNDAELPVELEVEGVSRDEDGLFFSFLSLAADLVGLAAKKLLTVFILGSALMASAARNFMDAMSGVTACH
jgi:hypothetical protein